MILHSKNVFRIKAIFLPFFKKKKKILLMKKRKKEKIAPLNRTIYSIQMSLFKSPGSFHITTLSHSHLCVFLFLHPSQSRPATDPRSRPRAPPPCAPSDGPTRCCTWSRSAWRAWPCSTGWRACSWRCTPPLAPSGSAGEARAGPTGTSPGVRPIPDSHHLQRDERMRRSECFIGTCKDIYCNRLYMFLYDR